MKSHGAQENYSLLCTVLGVRIMCTVHAVCNCYVLYMGNNLSLRALNDDFNGLYILECHIQHNQSSKPNWGSAIKPRKFRLPLGDYWQYILKMQHHQQPSNSEGFFELTKNQFKFYFEIEKGWIHFNWALHMDVVDF